MTDGAGPLEELMVAGLDRETALTIGVFDGVHRGHLYLLDTLRSRAAARGLAAGVITLHPHPALVFDPLAGIAYLTSLEERVRLLRESGVDFVLPLTFTPEVAHLSAEEFVAHAAGAAAHALPARSGRTSRSAAGAGAMRGCCRSWARRWASRSSHWRRWSRTASSSARRPIRAALEAGDIDTVNRAAGPAVLAARPRRQRRRAGQDHRLPDGEHRDRLRPGAAALRRLRDARLGRRRRPTRR